METVFREVLNTSTDQRLKREYYFNRYEKFRPFKVGDLVYISGGHGGHGWCYLHCVECEKCKGRTLGSSL